MGDATEGKTAADGTTPPKKTSSLERIERLERLERERLEEKQRKDEDRDRRIAGDKPTGGRHDLVDRIEHVTRYPLTLLGFAWLVLLFEEKAKGSNIHNLSLIHI